MRASSLSTSTILYLSHSWAFPRGFSLGCSLDRAKPESSFLSKFGWWAKADLSNKLDFSGIIFFAPHFPGSKHRGNNNDNNVNKRGNHLMNACHLPRSVPLFKHRLPSLCSIWTGYDSPFQRGKPRLRGGKDFVQGHARSEVVKTRFEPGYVNWSSCPSYHWFVRGSHSVDLLFQASGDVSFPPGLRDSVCNRDLICCDSSECSSSRGCKGQKAEDISVCASFSCLYDW